MEKQSTSLMGSVGVHYVCAVLSMNGLIALPTVRNTKGLRIINLNKSVKSCIVIAWRKLMLMQYKESIMHCAAYLTNVHGACGQLQKPDHCHMEV